MYTYIYIYTHIYIYIYSVCVYVYVFIMNSFVSGHLGFFCVLAIVNSDTMHIEVHISFLFRVSFR